MRTFIIILSLLAASSVKAQSFTIGGGSVFGKNLPFFNVEGGKWNLYQTRWNVYAGLKARVIVVNQDDMKAGTTEDAEDARFTPYLRLGYTLIRNDRRVFGELSLTLEQSPELGAAFHWRITNNSNICMTVLPRVTLIKNDLTSGAYLQLTFGL